MTSLATKSTSSSPGSGPGWALACHPLQATNTGCSCLLLMMGTPTLSCQSCQPQTHGESCTGGRALSVPSLAPALISHPVCPHSSGSGSPPQTYREVGHSSELY